MTAKNAAVVKLEKGTSDLVRPLYSAGLLLRDDDLRQAVDYTRDLSRLLFRSFFGCGVICGLRVEVDSHCGPLEVVVNPGVALDCHGDPIHVAKEVVIKSDVGCDPDPEEGPLWVLIRHYEKCCAPRIAMCSSEEDDASTSVCTREREGYEVFLTDKEPTCACGCLEPEPEDPRPDPCHCVEPDNPCYRAHYNGECGCHCGHCTDCDCEWIILARLDYDEKRIEKEKWAVSHAYRRFIRPLLMIDPLTLPPPKAVKQVAAKKAAKKIARKTPRPAMPG